jgi:hypothetical protein
MKFLLDFNLSLPVVTEALRSQGHEVVTAWDVNPKPYTDRDIFETAAKIKATLIIVSYRGVAKNLDPPPEGLVVIRPFVGQTFKNIIARLTEHFRPIPPDLPRLPFHQTSTTVKGIYWIR